MSSLPTRPMTPAPTRDLTDAEFAELDELLAATPEPLEPVDVVMLDGFLCGVIVQPVLLRPDTWLPHVFDFDARPLPDDVDPAWLERTTALILRRHTALNRSIVEDGWFEPLVLESDGESGDLPGEIAGLADAAAGDRGAAVTAWPGAASADAPAIAADEPAAEADEPVAARADSHDDAGSAPTHDGLSPISRALMPWVAGFQHATIAFPDLAEMPDDAVMAALARLYRHLPAETAEEREVVATLARDFPLDTLDDAMEELVVTIADLQDLTSEQRYKVDTVRREAPKVGRNDPCPCGSGKKFKQCHGAS